MPEDIKSKLSKNSIQIDNFIKELLITRKPEILYEASHHLLMAGGKRLRPYLTVKACEAVGGKSEHAIPFAAGLEILHNFTLVHDDIMDNDQIRRGTPTVHKKYGVPIAICAGDLLHAKVYEAFITQKSNNVSLKRIVSCIKSATDATIVLCEGQVLDLLLPTAKQVTENDYLSMVGGKTASLFKSCAEVGALVGGGKASEVKRLGLFAYYAGIAFQIMDDCLSITSDEKTFGKSIGNDIKEGKKTLIIIHAVSRAKRKQRDSLLAALGNPNASYNQINAALKVLNELGSVNYAFKTAEKYTAKAKKHIKQLSETTAKSDLLELIDYFTMRNY